MITKLIRLDAHWKSLRGFLASDAVSQWLQQSLILLLLYYILSLLLSVLFLLGLRFLVRALVCLPTTACSLASIPWV